MDEWHLLRRRWTEALAAHDWPVDREIKYHGMRTGEVPPALADELIGAPASCPIECFVYAQLDRLVDALLLGPSHHSIGLQAADLVVATARAAQRELGDASRWHKQLLPSFARHPDTGALDGVGLVVYPRPAAGEDPPVAKLFPI